MPRPLTARQQIGAAAEQAACALLQQRGLQCLARNVSYPFGEIDLVMLDAGTVVFVEVRYRRGSSFGGGAVSVDAGKRRRIALAAQAWLDDNRKFARAACRFDVIAISGPSDALCPEWIPTAFTLDDVAG
jgi:putative endonuclease